MNGEEGRPRYELEWVQQIADIPREQWDALAEALPTPVLEWEWLRLMEASGSVRPETGWLPLHLVVRSGQRLVAAAPLYVKGHSEGEFVWDYIWADVAQRLGVRYYPKLVGMSPATPVSGYRFLIAPGEDEQLLTTLMLQAIDRLCRDNKLAGLSFNYVDPGWKELMQSLGFSAWEHQSFLWENEGFASFEDYLGVFDKNQRRNIRRERRKMELQGLRLEAITGEQITRDHLRRMFHFYELTNEQFGPWAAKYLTAEFFSGLYEGYRHRLLLLPAYLEGREDPVGMSFLLTKAGRLYGRYWGAEGRFDSLHFNACYYGPIEWAIRNGMQSFDPGIGSAHKLRRGFRAVGNWSLHRFYDERLSKVMRSNIERINLMEAQAIEELNQGLPFAERRIPP
jgi:predicted N-acyltransferase